MACQRHRRDSGIASAWLQALGKKTGGVSSYQSKEKARLLQCTAHSYLVRVKTSQALRGPRRGAEEIFRFRKMSEVLEGSQPLPAHRVLKSDKFSRVCHKP